MEGLIRRENLGNAERRSGLERRHHDVAYCDLIYKPMELAGYISHTSFGFARHMRANEREYLTATLGSAQVGTDAEVDRQYTALDSKLFVLSVLSQPDEPKALHKGAVAVLIRRSPRYPRQGGT